MHYFLVSILCFYVKWKQKGHVDGHHMYTCWLTAGQTLGANIVRMKRGKREKSFVEHFV